MAYSSCHTKPHFLVPELDSPFQRKPICQGRSYTNFICKSLFFALILILLSLFPSKAPDFFNQTVIAKFWEFLHLMFIGIAVSYGIFSRRNVEMDINDNTQPCVSRMVHVTSIFEDGFEDPCGSGDKRTNHSWNFESFYMEPMDVNGNGFAFTDKKCKPHLSNFKNEDEISCGYDEMNAIEAWNNQHFRGETLVSVGQPNHVFYQRNEPGLAVDYKPMKPLALPVRSLRSTVKNSGSSESDNGSESSSNSKCSSKSSKKSGGRIFGDLGPMNLEDKFDEAFPSSFPIPWHSRSRTEIQEKRASTLRRPLHSRPLSVDESQNRSLKSRSSRSPVSLMSQSSSVSSSSPLHSRPLSVDESRNRSLKSRSSRSPVSLMSQSSSMSSSSRNHSPSYSIWSEFSDMEMEDPVEMKSNGRSSPSAQPSIPAQVNCKSSLNASHCRGYSVGSLSEKGIKEGSDDHLKEPSERAEGSDDHLKEPSERAKEDHMGIKGLRLGSFKLDIKEGSDDHWKELREREKEDRMGIKGLRLGSLKLDMNPTCLTKAPPFAKSVRTIRANGNNIEAVKAKGTYRNQIDESVQMKIDGDEAVDTKNGVRKSKVDSNNCRFSNPTHSKYENKETREFCEVVSSSAEDLRGRAGKFQVSLDEKVMSDFASDADAEPDTYGVDKKADEFIAKFREQIKLQKMASIGRSKELSNSGNYFR